MRRTIFLLFVFAIIAAGQVVWSPPVTLATETTGKIVSPSVATNATGLIVAAWSQNNVVQTIIRTGRVWGSPISLSTPGQPATSVAVSVSSSGDAAAVWAEGAGSSSVVKGAFYSAGAWGPATMISSAGMTGVSPQIGYDGLNNATVAWFESAGTTCAIRSAIGSSGTGWRMPVTVSSDCYSYLRLAVNKRGEAALTWGIPGPVVRGGSPVPVAFRTAGGIWGAQVLVSSGSYRSSSPVVALGDIGGAVVVWGDAYGVYWSRRASNGSWSAPGTVDNLNLYAGMTAATADPAGNIVAAYTIVSYDSGGGAVYPAVARRLRLNSFAWSNAATITGPYAIPGALRLSASPGGSVIAGWEDLNTGNAGVSSLLPGAGWSRAKLGVGDNDMAVDADQRIGVALWNRYWTTPSTLLVSTASVP